MKLSKLIPIREAEDEAKSNPDLAAIPFFREFHSKHGFKPLFKYIGTKGGEMIFIADIEDLGALNLVIKDAQLIAKVTEKEAMFGAVCTTTGLDKYDYPICKMKLKDGQIEHICYDPKDKKNFGAAATKFMSLTETTTAVSSQPGSSIKEASNKGLYPVDPGAIVNLKRAVAQFNNYIKNTKAPQPELLVQLVLNLVEAEVEQEHEDNGTNKRGGNPPTPWADL